jgi:hypothetical protein
MTTTEQRPVVVGDIFDCSWGYDQTNIDYYQVVRMSKSGTTVWLRRLCTAVTETSAQANKVAPLPDTFYGNEILQRRLRFTYGEWHVSIASYASASLWNMAPRWETAAGFGH